MRSGGRKGPRSRSINRCVAAASLSVAGCAALSGVDGGTALRGTFRRREVLDAGLLVSGGVLQGYVLSSYSARRLGLPTTGNAGGVHNLLVRPTAGPLEELIKQRFVLGSPENCYDGLKPYWEEFGVNHIIIRTHWVSMPLSTSLASMRLISDELLPVLQGVSSGVGLAGLREQADDDLARRKDIAVAR